MQKEDPGSSWSPVHQGSIGHDLKGNRTWILQIIPNAAPLPTPISISYPWGEDSIVRYKYASNTGMY